MTFRRAMAMLAAMLMLVAACSDDAGSGDEAPAEDPPEETEDPPEETPDPPDETPDPPEETPDPPEERKAATPTLDLTGDQAVVDWDQVSDTYIQPAAGSADPFFQIHSSNEADGFYLNFELFTVWGETWTGETGTFPIECNNPQTDTGLCVHFDPDGPGPEPVITFDATGSLTINQLDAEGYDIDVAGLTFAGVTAFEDFTISG